MDRLTFFRGFVKNWRAVGSITPSSTYLENRLLAPVDWSRAKMVVELGPGVGGTTKKILSRLAPDGQLWVFETNPDFCRGLEALHDPRLHVQNVSAMAMAQYVSDNTVDCVVSGIPLSNMDERAKSGLVEVIHRAVKPSGLLLQYGYTTRSRHVLTQFFTSVRIQFEPLNIPPAFVYVCTK